MECHGQGQVRTHALNAIFSLLETGQDPWAAKVASRGLRFVGPQDKDYIPRLIRAISQPARRETANAVANAAIALGQIGPDARVALPQLTALLAYSIPNENKSDFVDADLARKSTPVRKAAEESIRKLEQAPTAPKPATK